MRILKTAALMLLLSAPSYGDVIFTLTEPDLVGSPGSTVGWGFTIINETSDYLFFSGSQFNTLVSVGMYTDFAGSISDPVAPGETLDESIFDETMETGLGSVDITAPEASYSFGTLVLTYDSFSTDPTVDPNAIQDGFSLEVSAPGSVSVVSPEPSALTLLISVLLAAGIYRLLRGHRSPVSPADGWLIAREPGINRRRF